MRNQDVPTQCAVALLRTVFTYGIGHTLAELAMSRTDGENDNIARIRRFSQLLSPQAPDELIRTALLVCDDCDMTAQFDIGLDLMIRGLDAYLDTSATDTAS